MVLEKVMEIIAGQFEVERDTLTLETSFVDDLRADSIDLLDLIMSVEDEFGIEVPDDQLENVKTIGDVVGYLEEIAG